MVAMRVLHQYLKKKQLTYPFNMAQEFIRYTLNKSNRCEQVETSKAYALRWKKEIHFLPKSSCKMYDINLDNSKKWIVEIPVWLIEKNKELSEVLKLIQQENES